MAGHIHIVHMTGRRLKPATMKHGTRRRTRPQLINLEEFDDHELDKLKAEFERVRQLRSQGERESLPKRGS